MSTLRRLSIDLELGQTILVGPNRKPAEITKIEYHDKSGDVTINTTQGPRKVLTFSLLEDLESSNSVDKYRY
jgi:hypothetical protein